MGSPETIELDRSFGWFDWIESIQWNHLVWNRTIGQTNWIDQLYELTRRVDQTISNYEEHPWI